MNVISESVKIVKLLDLRIRNPVIHTQPDNLIPENAFHRHFIRFPLTWKVVILVDGTSLHFPFFPASVRVGWYYFRIHKLRSLNCISLTTPPLKVLKLTKKSQNFSRRILFLFLLPWGVGRRRKRIQPYQLETFYWLSIHRRIPWRSHFWRLVYLLLYSLWDPRGTYPAFSPFESVEREIKSLMIS